MIRRISAAGWSTASSAIPSRFAKTTSTGRSGSLKARRPYPCRFAISSKVADDEPEYTIQFRDWKFGSDVADEDFAFKNASGAKPVDMVDVGDLPENFKLGDAK